MINNPHEQRLDDIEKARKLWQESEWRLQFLRTETGNPLPQVTAEEILAWYRQHQN
jgi:hypothetical protein